MKKDDEGVILQTMRYTFELLEHFHEVREINIGGGLGVAYRDSEEVSDPVYLFQKVREIRDEFSKKYGNRQIDVSIEPGRYIVADSSVLLCRITSDKKTP
jgi:diaminopimelate decarboxylase